MKKETVVEENKLKEENKEENKVVKGTLANKEKEQKDKRIQKNIKKGFRVYASFLKFLLLGVFPILLTIGIFIIIGFLINGFAKWLAGLYFLFLGPFIFYIILYFIKVMIENNWFNDFLEDFI